MAGPNPIGGSRESTGVGAILWHGTTAAAAAIVLGFFVVASAPGQDQGLALLHKMQQALGGADAIGAIRDLDWTVEADTFNHQGKLLGSVTKRTRWIRPNYLRLDQVGPGDTYVLYFDGTSGWEILPDKPGVRDLVGSELEFAKGYLSGFLINTWLADRTGQFAITSPAPNTIRLTAKGETNDIVLDPISFLPVKSLSVSLADRSHPLDREDDTLEWTEVQGINFPSQFRNAHRSDGSGEGKTTRVALNTGLDPRVLAAKPADLKPVLTP
jgi:hypothetical protein